MRQERIEDIHNEAEKRVEKIRPKIFQKVPTYAKVAVAVITTYIAYLAFKGAVSKGTVITLLLAAGLIIWLFLEEGETKDYIDLDEAKVLLYKKLKEKKFTPYDEVYEIPPEAMIVIKGPGRLRWLDSGKGSKPWKYEIGYEIRHSNGKVEQWSAEVEPYTGKILSYVQRPEGFSGREATDVKYIRSPTLEMERRYERAGGVLKPGATRRS